MQGIILLNLNFAERGLEEPFSGILLDLQLSETAGK